MTRTRTLSHAQLVTQKSATLEPIPSEAPLASTPGFTLAEPALALLEFSSIAQGMVAADAMAKRAQAKILHAGTVQPGRYLVLLGGAIAEIEEALQAGKAVAETYLEDTVWLPGVHPDVMRVLQTPSPTLPVAMGRENTDALGIIETRTAPSAIHGADIAIKGAQITLLSIRLSDGLHGKGLVLLRGQVSDVTAALELVKAGVNGTLLLQAVCIPQLHVDMLRNIFGETRFFR